MKNLEMRAKKIQQEIKESSLNIGKQLKYWRKEKSIQELRPDILIEI